MHEPLEDRRLLATVDVVGNVLTFDNNGVEQNELTISLDSSGNLVLREQTNDVSAAAGVTDLSTDPLSVVIPATDFASINELQINVHSGDDILSIDNSNGLIPATITFNGDAGFDSLRLFGSSEVETTYNPGLTVDAGIVVQEGSGVTQRVDFAGLEPIQVLAPVGGNNILNLASAPLGIGFPAALNSDNAINYVEGPNSNDPGDVVFAGAITGLLTVDGFESLEFANFEVLNISAGPGSDEINLNNPVTPAELGEINVDAGDPTAGSDVVIVNGTAGANNIAVGTLTDDGAQISGLGPVLNVDTAERLIINGGGGNDSLTVTADDADEVIFIPGTAEDAGLVSVQSNDLGPLQQWLPVEYVNLGADGNLTISSTAGTRNLDLHISGTETGDYFSVLDDGSVRIAKDTSGFLTTVPIFTPGANDLYLQGLAGDDVFEITGDHPFDQGVSVIGGQPDSGSDELNIIGSGADIRVSLNSASITETGSSRVSFSGVESIDINAGLGAIAFEVFSGENTLTIDQFSGTGDGRLQHNLSPGVEFHYSTSTMTTLSGGNGYDTLVIESGADDNRIDVDAATIDVDGSVITLGDGLDRLVFDTGDGDDTVGIDVSGGFVEPAINIAGGNDFDRVEVTGTPLVAISTVEYTVGPNVDEGRVEYLDVGDSVLQSISFTGLEPFDDNLVANTVEVNATAGNNAINYAQGPGGGIFIGDTGLVTVDAFESYQFNNKNNLRLNGLAGDDKFNLNSTVSPAGFGGNIIVEGGEPTGSDRVIVNGSAGQDNILINTLEVGRANILGAQPNLVIARTIEHLLIEGGGGNDELRISTPDGPNRIDFTPGDFSDSGSVTVESLGNVGLLPISFENLGAGGVGSSTVEFIGFNNGDDDTLFVSGTEDNDDFLVNSMGNVTLRNNSTPLPIAPVLLTRGVSSLVLQGLSGDDDFHVEGDHPLTRVEIEGGGPDSGSDVLNFFGSGGNQVIVDLDFSEVSEGFVGPVGFAGVETINVNAANDLLVVGTPGKDSTVVSPTGPNSGSLRNNVSSPLVNFSNVTTFTINQAGGDDELQVNFGSAADNIDVDLSAGFGVIGDGVSETVNFLKIDTESVVVNGNDGDDTFTVTPDPNIPVFIDGGDPIGESAGDTIIVAGPAIFEQGPQVDEGGFIVPGNERISFDHIEAAVVGGGVPPVKAFISGNGADNDITVIARDASTHAGADGIRDFTTTVDDGLEVLWLDFDQLVIDAQSGDDDIVFQVPAPNSADWDVDAWVYGGAPAAGPGDDGDRLVVETPQSAGADSVFYIPTGVDSGNITIDENDNGVFDGTDTMIQIGNVPAMPPMPGFPLPDPGGVELLVYDGGGDDDAVAVLADIANNGSFHHVPGSLRDQGYVGLTSEGETRLGLNYENMGLDGSILLDGRGGNNSLTAFGTAGTDVVTVGFTGVNATDIELETSIGAHIDLLTDEVQGYIIETLEGDDDINLVGVLDVDSFSVRGGGPSAGSDTLLLAANLDPADNDIVIQADVFNPDDQDILGLAAPVHATGIELINIVGTAAVQDDSLSIRLGIGDNHARVEAGPRIRGLVADLVTSDSLPDIGFTGLDDFNITALAGNDVATFVTRSLSGATNTNYTFDGDEADLLVIEGANGELGEDDRFVATNPAAGSVMVEDEQGNNVFVTATNPAQGLLHINSLGGDDALLVFTTGPDSDVIGVPITFDGGLGSDSLSVTGAPTTPVDEVIYSPGQAVTDGRLLYEDDTDLTLMKVDFTNLEPVFEGLIATTLTVNGTAEENDITFEESNLPSLGSVIGRVTVDGFESIDFVNKTNLQLNGDNGNDTIVIDNPEAVTQLEGVVVNGGNGDDEITVLALPDASATGFVVASLNGNDGDDVIDGSNLVVDTPLIINGFRGDDILIGGRGNDAIRGNEGDDLMIGGDPAITPDIGDNIFNGGDGYDTIGILGTSAADTIDINQLTAGTFTSTVNGDVANETFIETEAARTDGELNSDIIRLEIDDSMFANAADPAADVLAYTVVGGANTTSDRLIVVDDGLGDTIIHRQSQVIGSGTVSVAPAHPIGVAPPITYEQIERVDVTPIDSINGRTGDDENGRLFVFKADPHEANDQLVNATFLGSGANLNLDPTIDPGPGPLGGPADQDWYRFVADSTGTLDVQIYFDGQGTLANGRSGLPGNGDLALDGYDADGDQIAGAGTFGAAEVGGADSDERIRMPVVAGRTYYVRVSGGELRSTNVYSLTAINEAPPIPFDLELLDNPADGATNPPGGSSNSDTGRSQFDNHTYDDTPTLFFRLDDGIFLNDLPGNDAPGLPPDEIIPIPFQPGVAQPAAAGYAIAIFDEGNTPPQTGTAPQTPLGFATAVAGQQGVYTFTVPNASALSEGSHFLIARVQMLDAASPLQTGFGERSESLEIVVDVTPPPVYFGLQADGNDGLHPDSDSGDPALPATFDDRITNDETPTFFGRAEANSIVRAYLDLDDSGTLTAADLLIGQTVASPFDGTNQLETPLNPNEPGGEWGITSTVNMNDPDVLAALGLVKDGLRRILVSAEDLAGNITAPDANEILEIFVDTQGPQVTGVFITDFPAFDIFTLKPDTPQPTPRVDSLTISMQDLPSRIVPFLYSAVSNVPPLAPIVLSGDHSGVIPISSLAFSSISNGPGIATGEIILGFSEPLPDDRFTLTLSDNIIDPVGNQLDGENNAAEPIGTPFFPTGDNIPGGDFIARFTVDSRPEVATWSQGIVYADINGNFVWDPEGQDNDFTNRDFAYNFGEITDAYFAGNFSSVAGSSWFDKVGSYGAFNGTYEFFLDTDDDGVGDTVGSMTFQVNAIPVAGNFFNSAADDAAVLAGGRPRDEIGAFDGQNWYLDVNGNNNIDIGEQFATNLRGIPVVGDFNGDGDDDLATFNNDTGQFQFDLDRDGTVDNQVIFGFSGFGEKPIAGDFNLDGIDDIGLWVPGREGQLPKESGEFHFLISDNVADLPSNVFEPFSPAPLGNDLISQFGDEFALPLFGNFDPPIAKDGSGVTFVGTLTNDANPLDTNLDGVVSTLDALVVINALDNQEFAEASRLSRTANAFNGFRLDASADGNVSSIDALVIINWFGQQANGASAEQVDDSSQSRWITSTDRAMHLLGDDDDDLLAILAADQETQRVKS